jgi:uncharacterized protein
MPSLEQAQAWYPIDPVHGFDHVARVYHLAEQLARAEGADLEVVRAAALLHDALPPEAAGSAPADRPTHHLTSAEFAAQVLAAEGWPADRCAAVAHAIRAHRFRGAAEAPQTPEAQVLFDADKLDAIGATGVARAIAYAVAHGNPIYAPPSAAFRQHGQYAPDEPHSAYHEYIFKLRKLKDRLYTPSARQLAEARHHLLVSFFETLAQEAEGA